MRPLLSLFLAKLLSTSALLAQLSQSEHTLRLEVGATSPSATLEAATFLEGTWSGVGLGGTVEETWSAPAGGAMMGMFRALGAERPNFYEFFILSEKDGSLELRLKHFDPTLSGWEEKDDFVTFRLVKAEPNTLFFEGLTMKREGAALNVWVLVKKKDGEIGEFAFSYKRSTEE